MAAWSCRTLSARVEDSTANRLKYNMSNADSAYVSAIHAEHREDQAGEPSRAKCRAPNPASGICGCDCPNDRQRHYIAEVDSDSVRELHERCPCQHRRGNE